MVGAVVVVFLHNVPYKWFQVFPVFLYPVSLVLLAFVTLMGIITGDRVNGAARWMTFMGLQFQPSELAKMAVIIAVSFILSKRQDEYGANPNAFKYIMILTGLVFLLIAPENLSTAMLLFGVVCMMMFIGRVSSKKLFGMLGILGLVGGVAVGILMAIPAKHCTTLRDFTVSKRGRIVFPVSLRKKKCRQPNLILTKTHRLHTRESLLLPAM